MFINPLKWKNEIIPNYYMSNNSEIINISNNQILKPFPNKEGNLVVWITMNGISKMMRLDYLIISTLKEFYDDIIRIVHLDDDPFNCNIDNLLIVRKSDIIEKYKKMYNVEKLEDIEEEWKTYSNIPTIEISNTGLIRDLKTKNIINPKINHGYKWISLNGSYYFIHRLVAELFVENPKPDKYFYVNHLDGNKDNNIFYNLEWCNISMNTEHAYLSGLSNNKYDEETIRNICQLLEVGLPHILISQITGVNRKYISRIFRGERWKNISSEYNFIKKIPLSELYNEDAIYALLKSGYSPKEISSILKIEYNNSFTSFCNRIKNKI